jgi:hypothetical protein
MGNACSPNTESLISPFLTGKITREYRALEAEFGSFVYIVQAGEDGPVKIGAAARPTLRVVELQVANWQELHLRAAVPVKACGHIEGIAHAIAAKYSIRGEWFDLSPARAVEIVLAAVVAAGQDPKPLKQSVAENWGRDEIIIVPRVSSRDEARRHQLRVRLGME